MPAVSTLAVIGLGLSAAGAAQGAYTGKRQGDAADKAAAERSRAKAQLESDEYNRNNSQNMRLLRQRVLAGKSGMNSAPTLGGGGPAPITAQKTALGA